ncbi:MAG TPA: VOC family protein [Acidimicrobiales bacterium]|nr:VOC family protein [Acidimicrobiales bacterium]
MAGLVGLHHAALTVSDVEHSARWYQDVLGMEEVFSEDGDIRRAVIMRIPGAGAVFAVVQHIGAEQPGFDPRRNGLDHLAFTVANRADMEAWAAALSEHGVAYDGPFDVPPGAILNFKDPDGIALSLFWER